MSSYTAIPHQISQDLMDGKIDSTMFMLLFWLFMRANYRTGVAVRCSADQMQAEMWKGNPQMAYDAPSLRTIREKLKRLDWMGYIVSHYKQGRRGVYAITINNYPTLKRDKNGEIVKDADGVGEEIILRPVETKSYEDWLDAHGGEDVSDPSSDPSSDHAGDPSSDLAVTLPITHSPTLPDSPSLAFDSPDSPSPVSKKERKSRLRSLRSLRLFRPSLRLVKQVKVKSRP